MQSPRAILAPPLAAPILFPLAAAPASPKTGRESPPNGFPFDESRTTLGFRGPSVEA
jgi:hypothetical protein